MPLVVKGNSKAVSYTHLAPAGAAAINKFGYAAGGWKGLIVYDPEDDFDENAADFFNVTISGCLLYTSPVPLLDRPAK